MAHYFILTFFKAGKHSGSHAIHPVQPEIMTTALGAELGKDMLLLKTQPCKKQTLQTKAIQILTVAIPANE